MRRGLLALILVVGCASPEPEVELSPLGEPPPESRREPEPEPEPPAADPEPEAPAPAPGGPAWIEASALEDGAASLRLANVLEPVRSDYGIEGLVLCGSLSVHYDGAEFYGQVQAHNAHAAFDLRAVLPDGQEHAFALKHSWGKLPKHATRDEVVGAVSQDVDQALEAWLFGLPAVQALASDPQALAEQAEASRQSLLQRLQERRLGRGRLAKAATGWGQR